jgi:uncharacterized membrane-anchored protein YjiN (DUF445 family)
MNDMKNKIGSLSLLIAFLGLIILELLLHYKIVTHITWKVITAGFEAATIGGFADWFAVRALFYEIPIPFIRKHTNIIAKTRDKLTEGIVDLVTNKWLSPEIISEKLQNVDIAKIVLDFLQQPKNKDKAISLIQKIVIKLSDQLDNPKLTASIKKILVEQVTAINFSRPIGIWLEKVISNGDHYKIWELVIEASANSLKSADTKTVLLSKLQDAAKEYSERGLLKKATLFFAKKTGGINLELISDAVLLQIQELLAETKENPQHPIRLKFDQWLLEFAANLITEENNTQSIVTNLKSKLITYIESENTVENVITNWKNVFKAQLDNNESALMQFFIENSDKLLNNLIEDKKAQQKINEWGLKTISQMLTRFHDEIGNLVRSSLSKLENVELVQQIEEKVGNDLQYIRLNGAVVGGLVGVLIATVKILFGFTN